MARREPAEVSVGCGSIVIGNICYGTKQIIGVTLNTFISIRVKHGYVKAPMDWPYSSFRRYVKTGMYPPDWGGNVQEVEGVGRE